MKEGIHPKYEPVVFEDVSAGVRFITRSTMHPNETTVWEDGKTYPLVQVEVSSASHPFYTGQKILIDTAGRVDKFNKKYGAVTVSAKRKTRRVKNEKEN